MIWGLRSPVLPVVACLLAILGGCTRTQWLEVPADWPQEWRGRRPYATSRAYLYASTTGSAAEAARMVRSVAEDFEDAAGASPTRGLLIVTDVGDEPAAADLGQLFAIAQRDEAARKGKTVPSDAELAEQWEDEREDMKEEGLDPADLLRVMPLPLDAAGLGRVFDLPATVTDKVSWGAALSTEDAMADALGRMMAAALAEEEIGMAQRILMAPVMAFARGMAVRAMCAACEVTLFGQMVVSQPGLDAEARAQLLRAYRERKEGEADEHSEHPPAPVPTPNGP